MSTLVQISVKASLWLIGLGLNCVNTKFPFTVVSVAKYDCDRYCNKDCEDYIDSEDDYLTCMAVNSESKPKCDCGLAPHLIIALSVAGAIIGCLMLWCFYYICRNSMNSDSNNGSYINNTDQQPLSTIEEEDTDDTSTIASTARYPSRPPYNYNEIPNYGSYSNARPNAPPPTYAQVLSETWRRN